MPCSAYLLGGQLMAPNLGDRKVNYTDYDTTERDIHSTTR
jgi:hypothetical protein